MTGAGLLPGFYVHVPFCDRICPYCDFAVTRAGRDPHARLERFGRALLDEFALRPPAGADTLYFGGGTPSLAPSGMLAEWIEAAEDAGHVRPGAFRTVEANPEDLVHDPTLAEAWVEAGILGVSLGAQALDDERLRFLGRRHRTADVRIAVERLAAAGTPWISLDVIYGTRGQTAAGLVRELREAAALVGVTHLSAYELTIEPGTPFARKGETPADEAFFPLVHETLEGEGFLAYEVSNFAREPGRRSPHNQKYWQRAPYTGVGPSAHSFAPAEARRTWNHRGVGAWEDALGRGVPPDAGGESLTPRQAALEEVLLGLRTVDGLDLGGFPEEVAAANRERIADWEDRGLVRLEPPRVLPTRAGLQLADGLAREFDLEGVRA